MADTFSDIANAGLDSIEDLAELVSHFPGEHVLLYGPPGTGKTTLAAAVARLMAERRTSPLPDGAPPMESLQCHNELTDGPLMYSFLPNEQGGAFMIDGVAKTAWTNGTVLVLDEISHIEGAPAMSTLFKVMDDPKLARLKLPDGTYLTPSPGFTVIATMNDMPEVLPAPIQDRFSIKLCMWRPTKQAVDSLHSEALRYLTNKTYEKDPDNAFPTFRDNCKFERMCSVMAVDVTDEESTTRNRIAQLVWGTRWRDACRAIDMAAQAVGDANKDESDEDTSDEDTSDE